MRNFFMQIPDSFEEAAIIDGASVPALLFYVVLPLSVPSLVTVAMFYAVGQWNSWFDALIYMRSMDKIPLQMLLRNIINSADVAFLELTSLPPPLETVKSAAIIITTIPILLVYPFIQKYFVKGVMVGGIKG